MANTPMTPDQEFDFYAEPENQEPQGPARRRHASRLGTPYPCGSPRNCWSRPAARPMPTTGHYLRGSAGQSSTNCAGPPDPVRPYAEFSQLNVRNCG
jgi:hypothetical protein